MVGKLRARRGLPTWLGGATGGGLALLALVVFVLPASAAAPTMTVLHTTKVIAPFTGATASPAHATAVNGCGTATTVTAPFFHARSGDGGFSGSASARGCPTLYDDYADASQSFTATVPIPVTATAHHIAVKWSIHATGGQSLHVGTCTIPGGANGTGANNTTFNGCLATTEATLSGYIYVLDATNSTFYEPTNFSLLSLTSYTFWNDYCYDGSCTSNISGGAATFSVSGTMIWHFPVHGLLASHHYEVVATFYASQYVDIGAFGTATLTHTHGLAWVNCGTFGNGADLNSVTIW